MSSIADFIHTISEEKRLFFLRGQLAQMYKVGQGGRMGRLVIDPDWIAAQRAFDPSLQTYLQGAELAIRGIEEGQAGERGLLLLMVLSLMHGNARAITASLPNEALQLMSQDGRVEQARSLALQRPNPLERSQALLNVAQVESGLGNRNSAAETLALARQEIKNIAAPASRCRSMLSLLAAEQALNPDFAHLAPQYGQLIDLAETIPSWQTRARVVAEVANASTSAAVASGRPVNQDYGLTEIFNRGAKDIQNIYKAQKAATEKEREDNNRKIDRKAPGWYKLRRDEPRLHPTLKLIDDLKLWDQPVYLVYAAYLDQEPVRNDPLSWSGNKNIPPILAMLLRTTGNLRDQAIGKRISDLLLADAGLAIRTKNEGRYGWDTEKVIEAAAEAGYGDLALKLIAHKLTGTADVSKLRAAMARGSGRRGDIESIERAAGPIKPAGSPAGLRDRIDRAFEGAGDGLSKSVLSRLVAKGVSRADFERIAVYAEGYTGLKMHDAQQAEAFLASVCRRLGPAGEKLIHQILVVGMEGIENQATAWAEKLISAVDRLPWADHDELADSQVFILLEHADFDRALQAAAEVKNSATRSQLTRMIAAEMIKAGQLERAVSLAAMITDRLEQRSVYQQAMAYLAADASQETTGLTDRLTAGLVKLRDTDRVAKSPAFQALVNVLASYEAPTPVLDLLEPSGVEGLLAASEPLAKGIARIISTKQAVEAAEILLARLEKQQPSVARIHSACALVRAWGPVDHLAAAAQRAYGLALKDARSYKFSAPAPITGIFSPAPIGRKEASILTELAGAARALNDRKALYSLWEEANKIFTEKRGAEDLALIDICAGLASLGETQRKKHIDDFPPFKAIDWSHQPFAHLEVARAEGNLQQCHRYIEQVLQDLPQTLQSAETGVKQKDKPGKSSYKTLQVPPASNDKPTGIFFNVAPALVANADFWLRMIQAFADLKAYHAIPPTVLGAQRCLDAGKGQKATLFSIDKGSSITAEEMETIIDTAVTSLLEKGKVDLALRLADVLPDQQAGVEARLAATSENPLETVQTLERCLQHRWNKTNIQAVSCSAACLPGIQERLALAIKILQKARQHGRAEVLEALGSLVPLANTILVPEDMCSAVRRIIASESDW